MWLFSPTIHYEGGILVFINTGYVAVSYNGNKIISGSSGGCSLTDSLKDANKVRKWSIQARENVT